MARKFPAAASGCCRLSTGFGWALLVLPTGISLSHRNPLAISFSCHAQPVGFAVPAALQGGRGDHPVCGRLAAVLGHH